MLPEYGKRIDEVVFSAESAVLLVHQSDEFFVPPVVDDFDLGGVELRGGVSADAFFHHRAKCDDLFRREERASVQDAPRTVDEVIFLDVVEFGWLVWIRVVDDVRVVLVADPTRELYRHQQERQIRDEYHLTLLWV
jgi:hypothetical protein